MARTPEGKVKDKIKEVLDHFGAYYFMPVQVGYGKAGLDFHCCHKGRAFFIEAKAAKGVLSDRQKAVIEEIRKAGGVVFVNYGRLEDMDELRAFLRK